MGQSSDLSINTIFRPKELFVWERRDILYHRGLEDVNFTKRGRQLPTQRNVSLNLLRVQVFISSIHS